MEEQKQIIGYELSTINAAIESLNSVTVSGLDNMGKIVDAVNKLRTSAVDVNALIADEVKKTTAANGKPAVAKPAQTKKADK